MHHSGVGTYHHPPPQAAVPPAHSVGPGVYVPVVVVVKVPVVWEVPPRGGLVVVALGATRFFVFVGLGLVFQDLRDDSAVGLGGDEDLRENQRTRWSARSLAFVLSDPSRLGSG